MVKTLGANIKENNQLALLADQKTRMASMGEIDIETRIGFVIVRLRALVMENLQSVCFGGTTFHTDNTIEANINTGEIKIHGQYIVQQSNPVQNFQTFPPAAAYLQEPQCNSFNSSCSHPGQAREEEKVPTLNIAMSQVALPSESVSLSLPNGVGDKDMIAIIPRFDNKTHKDWPPQVCEIVDGCAIYINNSKVKPISHPKYAHFQTLPVKKFSLESAKQISDKSTRKKIVGTVTSTSELLDEIKVNEDVLTESQKERLKSIHTQNQAVFDGNLKGGYNQKFGRHFGSFSFKDHNKPPPTKVWAPQYNRTCADLHQAKCDELEEAGVLVDPKEHNIDILHVSPSFIQQKGRAKHKSLRDCTLDEVRFITGFNVLNEDIKPVTGRSTSAVDIFKFLGKWKHFIFADLYNSYFQIPMRKNLWGYLGIMTPFRGIKMITRAGQGLLNSDYELDQLLFKILGDEIADGKCMAARDDLTVGGNTIDEAISNWEKVLTKLRRSNLKITSHKVRIFLPDTEVYGYRIKNGKVAPSGHIVTDLGKTKIEDLKTVKSVNSWKGLYKTLIGHLNHLAHFMAPFDQATAAKESRANFEWTPQLTAAFNAATKHLDKINETYIPHPDDQLVLKPDTAKVPLCTGWTLYAIVDSKEVPVQYCSAKLPNHMANWFPCELEAVGAVLAIDQCSPWINESNLTTLVGPDSMPVVKAAQLMKLGRHSKNPRLQQLLTSVNRRNVRFHHNSAKAGYHIVPDTLSRLNRSCGAKDCAVERYLSDIPIQAECMPINVVNGCILDNITDILLTDMDPCMLAATSADLAKLLLHSPGSIPLGSRKAWRDIQESDKDCRTVFKLKTTGDLPIKKKTNPVINRLFKECVVEDGLLVVRMFDKHLMKEVGRVVVPPNLLDSILTAIHLRLQHPTAYQMQIIFDKYFFSVGVKQTIDNLISNCYICLGLKKFPKELQKFDPKLFPEQPGSHMNIDIVKRSGQLIAVNTDLFSSYTTACFTQSEKIDDLATTILQLITPIRHSHTILVRVDGQSSLKSLAKNGHESLDSNGIRIILGEDFNKNSNCCVDKRIQELEKELKLISPAGEKVSVHQLAKAVTTLNDRRRNQGLSAAEIHFSRDTVRGENLKLDDKKLRTEKIRLREDNHPYSAKSKAPKGKLPSTDEITVGDTVFIKDQGSKHEARSPFLVTGTKEGQISMRKILNTQPERSRPLTISSDEKQVDRKFVHRPQQKRSFNGSQEDEDEDDEYPHVIPIKQKVDESLDWTPSISYQDEEEDPRYTVVYASDISPDNQVRAQLGEEQDQVHEAHQNQDQGQQGQVQPLVHQHEQGHPVWGYIDNLDLNPPLPPVTGATIVYFNRETRQTRRAKVEKTFKTMQRRWPGWFNVIDDGARKITSANLGVTRWKYLRRPELDPQRSINPQANLIPQVDGNYTLHTPETPPSDQISIGADADLNFGQQDYYEYYDYGDWDDKMMIATEDGNDDNWKEIELESNAGSEVETGSYDWDNYASSPDLSGSKWCISSDTATIPRQVSETDDNFLHDEYVDPARTFRLTQQLHLWTPTLSPEGTFNPTRRYLIPPHLQDVWYRPAEPELTRSRILSLSEGDLTNSDSTRPSRWTRRILRVREFIRRVLHQ